MNISHKLLLLLITTGLNFTNLSAGGGRSPKKRASPKKTVVAKEKDDFMSSTQKQAFALGMSIEYKLNREFVKQYGTKKHPLEGNHFCSSHYCRECAAQVYRQENAQTQANTTQNISELYEFARDNTSDKVDLELLLEYHAQFTNKRGAITKKTDSMIYETYKLYHETRSVIENARRGSKKGITSLSVFTNKIDLCVDEIRNKTESCPSQKEHMVFIDICLDALTDFFYDEKNDILDAEIERLRAKKAHADQFADADEGSDTEEDSEEDSE